MGAIGHNINRMGTYIRAQEEAYFGGLGWETFVEEQNQTDKEVVLSANSANGQLLFLRKFYLVFALFLFVWAVLKQLKLIDWIVTQTHLITGWGV